jgi:hypothetical protein
LVLFGMQNRTFGPYLAANDKILISLVRNITKINPTQFALLGMQKRTIGTHRMTINRILIPATDRSCPWPGLVLQQKRDVRP